jgi:type II secretory pathway pseudopilin PulG
MVRPAELVTVTRAMSDATTERERRAASAPQRDLFARWVAGGAIGGALGLAVLSAEPLGFGGSALLVLLVLGFGIGCLCVGGLARWPRVVLVGSLGTAAAVAGLLLGAVLSEFVDTSAQRVGDRIAAALAAHRREHGSYPATLAELVPARLDAVPEAARILLPRPFHYAPEVAADDYWLSFDTGFFVRWSRSTNGLWRSDD